MLLSFWCRIGIRITVHHSNAKSFGYIAKQVAYEPGGELLDQQCEAVQ